MGTSGLPAGHRVSQRNEDGKCDGLDSCGSFQILLGDCGDGFAAAAASEMRGNDAFNRNVGGVWVEACGG